MLTQDKYPKGSEEGAECRCTKKEDLDWKQKFLTLNKKLEDVQTQIKGIKDEIKMKSNQKSISNWINDQITKV